eukprot:TRINITY_DN12692_c1_g1_i1.p2 TRINITY_DN12692_c1_g1~~TRINITY_DN12692_c1_g1_i1.p2  ORF type:complete len:100 (-),score=0.08 TRINITY_DN12692_c1_g1_i1:176-475(-)
MVTFLLQLENQGSNLLPINFQSQQFQTNFFDVLSNPVKSYLNAQNKYYIFSITILIAKQRLVYPNSYIKLVSDFNLELRFKFTSKARHAARVATATMEF